MADPTSTDVYYENNGTVNGVVQQHAETTISTAVGPPEKLTEQGIPSGAVLGIAFNDDGSLRAGWELDPISNIYVFSGRVQAATDQREVPASSTNVATTNPDQVIPEKTSTSDDPFEQARLEAAARNEQTGPTEQPVINAEFDPFEQARLAQEVSNQNQGPTDQAVVDAGQDTKLSSEEQSAQESQQAANREMLKGEDIRGGVTATALADGGKTASINQTNFKSNSDWRVKLSLAPKADYLYKAAKSGDILYPLLATDGVIFPYTPQISTTYRANYDSSDITHSNYKLYFYKNSAVDDISITADFTAQDNTEALYLLSVIHFFKSVTKMFYGQDKAPSAGTPPPLCYLSGYGAYQFDNHPLLLTSFAYSLPNDVDYIRASNTPTSWSGQNIDAYQNKQSNSKSIPGVSSIVSRLLGSSLKYGGMSAPPNFKSLSSTDATYVPTKIQITLTAIPIVTRNDISNNFSLRDYASGSLLRGSKRNGGGIW
jgi:hypothetical protein